MYVDSIYAKTFKEVAKLVSPMTTVPMSGCLSFQYQRSEERGNLFSVYTRDRLGQYQELWKAGTESHSDWSEMPGEWIPVQVDLKAPYSVQVGVSMSRRLYVHGTLKLYVMTFTWTDIIARQLYLYCTLNEGLTQFIFVMYFVIYQVVAALQNYSISDCRPE